MARKPEAMTAKRLVRMGKPRAWYWALLVLERRAERRASGSLRKALVGLAAASLGMTLLLPGTADEAQNLQDQLLSARFYSASVWTGTDIYMFGGTLQNGTTVQDVLKYTPSTGGNATKVANLPQAVHSMAAIWDGSNAFIFGGDEVNNTAGDGQRIVAYTPANNTAWEVGGALLPSGRQRPSAVWTGQHAYIIGGLRPNTTYVDEVVRFNTTSFAVDVVLDSTINATNAERIKRASTSAAWDGQDVYIFGGNGCPGPDPDDPDVCRHIVRYTPSNHTTAYTHAELPDNRSGTAAAYDGLAVYLFGNSIATQTTVGTAEILRYRPSTDVLSDMSADLPTARGFTNAIWNGTSVFVLTGSSQGDWPTAIVRYNLTPGKPETLDASSDINRPAEIRLNWTPPAANTHTSPITNYTLHRGLLGQAYTFLVTLGNVTSYTDTAVDRGSTYCYKVYATNAQGDGPPRPGDLDAPVCAPAY